MRLRDPYHLKQTLTWYADGLDFGDALHLAACRHLSDLRNFDQQFNNRVAGKGMCLIKRPNTTELQSFHSFHNWA